MRRRVLGVCLTVCAVMACVAMCGSLSWRAALPEVLPDLTVPEVEPLPIGTVLVSRNLDEQQNDSPGFWNHLAIYVGDFQLIESQRDSGVIATSYADYLRRDYRWMPLFPVDRQTGTSAATYARQLVGMPYRPGSSLFRTDRNPARGMNCVSVVRYGYAQALGHDLPELKVPDDILKVDFLSATPPR